MGFHDVLHDGQSEAAALDVVNQPRSHTMEALEDLLLFRARDPDTVVPYRDLGPLTSAAQTDRDFGARFGVLDRVVDQVCQRLPNRCPSTFNVCWLTTSI